MALASVLLNITEARIPNLVTSVLKIDKKVVTEAKSKLTNHLPLMHNIIMNRLSVQKRKAVAACLVEGNSIRATSRLSGVAINTVVKLLVDLGGACAEYQYRNVRGLKSKRVQADEIWCFCYCKERNVPEDKKGVYGMGDVWTWTAIDADTKMVLSWFVGRRNLLSCRLFMLDVAERISQRFQLTTDGFGAYIQSVDKAFAGEIDYAQLHKTYGPAPEPAGRYSPAACTGVTCKKIRGNPEKEHISTSYIERQNLTMRMSMRRFTRLTDAFSKKVENLEAAVALHFMHYNYCRVHGTLKTSPAVAAGLTNQVWSLDELASLA
ncbi:MAG: IS1 family transposase [Fimbriimonadales bacterium]